MNNSLKLILFIFLFNSTYLFSQQLKVSENKRFLVKPDGTPFFYMGDTAWELFHRLDREEADKYLKNRADNGFTVIQAVVLAELEGLKVPNPYCEVPLKDMDPTQLNEAYFEHVEYIVNKANELGLFIGMLPTWGDKVFKHKWGAGPEVFNPENARKYGELVGKRFKGKNIIWIMGGDRNPETDQHLQIWRAMAEGITQGAGDGDPEKVMMTYHPQPMNHGSSSQWFHNDSWLDFNMFQTGHCRDVAVFDKISKDYNLTPTKPTMDGEPIYEDHPVCFNPSKNGYSEPHDVRKSAYLNLFAGAHGHTYGCHDVWQMFEKGNTGINGPNKYWSDAINLPGAMQMKHVRKLMESRPMLERVPDQTLVKETFDAPDRIQATRGKAYAFIYSASGKPFTVALGKISGRKLKASWYDPRTGNYTSVGEFDNKGEKQFTPPSSGKDNDWVLVLDDSKAKIF